MTRVMPGPHGRRPGSPVRKGGVVHEHFPSDFQIIFGSSITSTVIVVLVLNLLFNELRWGNKGLDLPTEVAMEEALDAVTLAVEREVSAAGEHVPAVEGQVQ